VVVVVRLVVVTVPVEEVVVSVAVVLLTEEVLLVVVVVVVAGVVVVVVVSLLPELPPQPNRLEAKMIKITICFFTAFSYQSYYISWYTKMGGVNYALDKSRRFPVL
jgi:hypothetical protein